VGQVQHAEEGQTCHVLGIPTTKYHGYVSKKIDGYALERSVVLVRENLGYSLHQGKRIRRSIARMSSIKGDPIE
jgi:hypothetical protein